MAKRKGRRPGRRLADLTIAPPDPPRYEPPPYDEEYGRRDGLAPDLLRHGVRRYHRNRLVGFAVTLDRWTGAEWQQLVRIDTAHGEVHMHRFLPTGGEERTVFEVIDPRRAEKVMERRFDWANVMLDNRWREFLKGWTGEVD
jgi:hypothetical protein